MATMQNQVHQPRLASSSNTTDGGTYVSPWLREAEPVRNGYDPLNFYVRATDTHGHGERVRITLPPEIYAQVQVLVHNEELPEYSMPSDFIRDAVVHHLHSRRDLLGTPELQASQDALIKMLNLKMSMAIAERWATTWSATVESLTNAMTVLLGDEAYAQMWVTLRAFEEAIDDSPEPYYSKGWLAVMEWRGKIPELFHTT